MSLISVDYLMCLGITINCVLGDDNLFERQHPSLTSSCAWNSDAVPSCWLLFLWALPSWSSCELPSVSLKTWKKADCVRVRVILDHCSCPQPAERAILKYSPHLSVGILFKDSIGDSSLTSLISLALGESWPALRFMQVLNTALLKHY